MDKTFDFAKNEPLIYNKWLDGNAFRAEVNPDKKPYTVIMPPPNVTARLHIGHAFGLTVQDIIVRFKRMQGFEALFLPGADHAAVATDVKVREELKKRGIDPNKISDAEFLQHVEEWYKIYTEQIKEQMKRLGLSCDWSRFTFTKDPCAAKAVDTVFNNLYKKGLIYKGSRMVNFCPGCKSALSDAEVEYKTVERTMYHIKYDTITVATVRPETIPGDVAIAVNPKDKRYAKFVGTTVTNPLTGAKIPVIADDYVDMKFGTGALKITPAHDMADAEIGARHGLKPIILKTEDLTDEARLRAIEVLKKSGALVKEQKYTGNISVCYRCFRPVEPTISEQWFLKMRDLAKPAIEALNNGLAIVPKKYEKIYLHWLNNIKDWCISRQIKSGYKIPIKGETDTLDTWFSSALWPFCTLGWPDNTPDFKYFYPTQTLVTAYEIIFFWVIRMVFSGIEATGKLPFERVVFTGLVRDGQGRKMSKSLGNGIDPVKIIDEFGTDVLRFSLIVGTKLDRDPRYSMEKATLTRNFINKIWNATKFFENMQTPAVATPAPKATALRPADKWILTKFNNLIKSVTKKYEKFDFGVAAAELQHFFWADFCDWYIEESKQTNNPEVYHDVLSAFLKLISPIMPFVTENIWTEVLGNRTSLLSATFPIPNPKYNFPKEFKEFEQHIERIKTERNAKSEAENAVKKIEILKKEIARGEQVLANKGFVDHAPKELVAKERTKLEENRKLLKELGK
ncbi:MAG: class I tRNA ligase family protein [Christensenellaceae bacterium]|nr:class I tRNA ligase family protein [Christensenellaceae bacterium]